MSIVHDLWKTSGGLVQYSSSSMELLHKTMLPTGWVLSTQSKIEKETQAVLWNKLTKKPWKFHEANRKQKHRELFQSGPGRIRMVKGPPPLCGDSLLPAVNFQERANHPPSTKLVLKYMELR